MSTSKSPALARRQLLRLGAATAALGGLTPGPVTAAARRPRAAGREAFLPGSDPAGIPPPPALPWLIERRIDVPEGRLHLLDSGGSGEAVVLIHAATGQAHSWDYQISALHAAGYRVLAYSRRGTKQSPEGPGPDNAREVGDLDALATALGLARFHLLGTASGGFIAVRYAAKFAHRLRSLTLSCSLLGLNEPDLARALASLLPANFQALAPEFRELSPSYRLANPDGVKRWLAMEEDSVAAQLAQKPDAAARMQAGVRGADGPRLAELAALNLPVHLIFGDSDLYAPPAFARRLMPHLRDGHLSIIGECAHAAHWEQPLAFNSAVLGFLSRSRQRA